ncbi:YybH family protein [Robertkochia aurantiaca]|uniref:YybH family protein n=1 Tax=Robertkochia aurantiaca TaxID=2873700 RepID=UPI001CC9FCB5|nr:nuclear transport factor 2 family protein [Robertkochia sp. 3YJGBD-33]
MNITKTWITSVVLIMTLSISFAQTVEDDKNEILEQLNKLTDALKEKDMATLVTVWTDDALLKFPGKPGLQGKEAIEMAHTPMMEQGIQIEAETDEIVVSGDFATEIGNYKIMIPGGTVVDHGTYSTLWKRSGDTWLIYRDVISSSQAPKNAGEDGK